MTWIAENRAIEAAKMLTDCVEVNPNIRGGAPVLKGTRVPVALILAEIADSSTISEIADDLDLRKDLIQNFIEGLAMRFDHSFTD